MPDLGLHHPAGLFRHSAASRRSCRRDGARKEGTHRAASRRQVYSLSGGGMKNPAVKNLRYAGGVSYSAARFGGMESDWR